MSLIGLFQLQGHTCEFVKFNIKYADITFNQTSSSFFILVTTISGLTPSVAAIIFCLFSAYLGQQKSVLCIIFALSTMNTYGVITVAFSLHKNTTSMIALSKITCQLQKADTWTKHLEEIYISLHQPVQIEQHYVARSLIVLTISLFFFQTSYSTFL